MGIRLEEIPFELNGKEYRLRCNMNVLADVQEQYDGDFISALDDKRTTRSVLVFLAAMLNDYADEKGWEERYTAKSLGRMLRLNDIPVQKIMRMVVRSVMAEPSPSSPEEPGN